MNVIVVGRSYELDGGGVLHFRQMDGSTLLRAGTTNEEVLEVLIHRVTEAYQAVPCQETVRALYLLYEALMAFRLRSERRASANVEGTRQPHDSEGVSDRFAILRDSTRERQDRCRP